jgi:hypothetical protein
MSAPPEHRQVIDIGPEAVCAFDLAPQRIDGGIVQIDHRVTACAHQVMVGNGIDNFELPHPIPKIGFRNQPVIAQPFQRAVDG